VEVRRECPEDVGLEDEEGAGEDEEGAGVAR
jgi:hypothetical protein